MLEITICTFGIYLSIDIINWFITSINFTIDQFYDTSSCFVSKVIFKLHKLHDKFKIKQQKQKNLQILSNTLKFIF